MSKVILQGHIIVSDSDLARVTNELANHITLTKAEHGCLIFKVAVDRQNPHKFNVYEEFVNQAAFDNHQQRVKQSTWGQVTQNVNRHYAIT